MVCGCIWVNYCGVCCGGVHEGNLLCSYWLCKPPDLRLLDPSCCHICACDGIGYNCLWEGCICCAPSYVVEWSGLRAAGMTALNTGPTVVVNNISSPGYVGGGGMAVTTTTTQQGYYGNPGMAGGNVNMNMNAGGANMNVNMNAGGANMNMEMGGGAYGGGAYGGGAYGGGANVTMNMGP